MTDTDTRLTANLSALITRELDTLTREIELFPDDASLWTTLEGVANSCGTLALHCAGNLQHYVGAVLGGSGYVRDRASEFGRRAGTRAELVAELRRARHAVDTTLPALTAATLDAEFPEAVAGVTLPTHVFLMHLASHLAFHVGQVDYLRRILHHDTRTAATVSVKALAG